MGDSRIAPTGTIVRDILVFTPVLRLEGETVRALLGLAWDGPLSLLLQRDNARQRAVREPPLQEPPLQEPPLQEPTLQGTVREMQIADHLWQYQRGRELFLQGRFDGMLVIESDIIPPEDALVRLAALDADVAYGCYVFQGGHVVNVLERYYAGTAKKARNIGEPLNVRGLYAAAVKKGVIECSGSGLGCTLIRREVIEAVPFEAPKGPTHFDLEWTQAVYSAGFRMMADMAVECGHVTPAGEVMLPSRFLAAPSTSSGCSSK